MEPLIEISCDVSNPSRAGRPETAGSEAGEKVRTPVASRRLGIAATCARCAFAAPEN